MARILIVEDEPDIASFLEKGLTAAGHTTMVIADGREAGAVARDDAFDLALLDLGLPGLDGMSVLRQIRARGERLPVIILTARDELESTLAGFEGGANDYVTKPFRFEEILARVSVRLAEAAKTDAGPSQIVVGSATLDIGARTLRVEQRTVELSAREFTLAETFFRHPGQVLSREQLLSRVWGYDFDPGSNVVDVYVGYLRKKLGTDALETVRGVGYRLRDS
ncbi:MAG: response regulator transcription factor [Ilumatobacter sp.]|jgi:DNA-binding response OmpR family regulator|uniref:response regulator transcription factor n=1 Tax=Ilumatobacter sp. TaxID=1967498 RepID=UPI00391CF5E7